MRLRRACLVALLVPALSCAALMVETVFASPQGAASRFKDVPPDGTADSITQFTVTQPKAPAAPSAPLAPDIPIPASPSVSAPGKVPVAGTGNSAGTPAGSRSMDPVTRALQSVQPGLAGQSEQSAGQSGSIRNQVPIAALDTMEGYAAQVMEKILPYWQPPADVSGVVTVSMQISSNGRLLYCEPVKSSGNVQLDESPCLSALKVSSFGNPPYGAISKVYLTLATDRNAFGAPPASNATKPEPGYAELLMERVRPHVQVPKGLKGSATAEIALQVSSKGGIEQISISRTSGHPDVDNAVLAALCTPGILPPFSDGMPSRRLQLLFTVKGNSN